MWGGGGGRRGADVMRWRRPSRAVRALVVAGICAAGIVSTYVVRGGASIRSGSSPLGPTPTRPLTTLPNDCAPVDLDGAISLDLVLLQEHDLMRESSAEAAPRPSISIGSNGWARRSEATTRRCAGATTAQRSALRQLLVLSRASEVRGGPAVALRPHHDADAPRRSAAAWSITWSEPDGRSHHALVEVVGVTRATLEDFVRYPGIHEPRYPAVDRGEVSFTTEFVGCGQCRVMPRTWALFPDGRFYGPNLNCRFVPAQARHFCDWMTARGWGHVSGNGGQTNISDADIDAAESLWTRLIVEPCAASWR